MTREGHPGSPQAWEIQAEWPIDMFPSSRGKQISLADLRLILEFWCLLLRRRGAGVRAWSRGEGMEQVGASESPSALTFWDPKSVSHYSDILSAG